MWAKRVKRFLLGGGGEMRRFLDMWAFLLFLCTPTLCSAVILGARLFSKQVSDPLERLAGAAFLTSVAAGPT
jgi:hypothetical protein